MANQTVQIEYHQGLDSLQEVLSEVRRSGDFFVQGAVEVPMPKLEVDGVGVISFPVPQMQVRQLVERAERAPYGRGEETILDLSVRKVWQLPPTQVNLGGKSWADSFRGILDRVAIGLGCRPAEVSAELYKVLMYDQGGFFKAHRDTEKTEGMFGTLVVVLPSAHRGGELLIRHAGREVTLELSRTEPSELAFAAFYADCEHEVRSITEGNRVCLVYNLVQQRGGKAKAQSLEAPDYQKQIAAVAELLEEHLTKPAAPAKIVWLLEHQYSPEGLSFAGLKNADAARAKVLAQAASRAGCAAHLGIVHIEESGAAEPKYDGGYRYGRGSRWRRYDEEELEEDVNSEDFEVIEVCDGRQYVDQWRDLRDEPVEFGEIPLAPGELLPAGGLDNEKPDEQRLTEASGNEGASFERSYHRAAMVLWRRERYAEVLLQAGVVAVLPYLEERIAACEAKSAPPSTQKETVALAQLLVNAWKEAPGYASFAQPSRPEKRDVMLGLLVQLGEARLLGEFIAEVVTRDYDGSENEALVVSAHLLGAKEAGMLYADLISQHMPRRPGACVDLLNAMMSACTRSANPRWREALGQIAASAVDKLDTIGNEPHEHDWMDRQLTQKRKTVDAELVTNLLDVLVELDAAELGNAAVKKMNSHQAVFDPVTILVPALQSVRAWDTAAKRLWEHSVEFLVGRSGRPPEAPKDWRQEVKLSCKCTDCCELQAFVFDPVKQIHRFRIRQDRRQHLHQMIEQHGLEMTHVTERKGSPQTLVCTKDRRSHLRRCEQYRNDIAALAALAELACQNDGSNRWINKIEAARALAAEWSDSDA